jgi:hypothetical protein
MEKKNLSHMINNWMSMLGIVLAAMAGVTMLFFLFIEFASKGSNPYLGILLYMVLPIFLIGGIILILIGMYLTWRRPGTPEDTTQHTWPLLDLNNPRHRRSTLIFLLVSLLFVLISTVGSYQAYQYSESVPFCGQVCHTVMKPEFTAYQNSPHARVRCVECHIGPGAEWFVRSKLSGLYQVYAVMANVYPRPIPTPIKDLRPAQTICEQCHWPEKFFGAKQWQFDHYLYNKTSSSWPINMLIKTGGGDPKTSQTSGIHWHMNIGVKIEYIAQDKLRQDIPWIRATDKQTGRVVVYQDTSGPLTPEKAASEKPRVLDCIDCHSRPSHDYQSPDHAVDLLIVLDRMNTALPEIKKAAVTALSGEYASDTEAREGIRRVITDFYHTNYPAVSAQKMQDIDKAIIASQEAYARNIFPVMKTKWSAYPNNIGHFNFRGCMRCHDGKHASESGAVITNNCRSCHIILSQGPKKRNGIVNTDTGLGFIHPVDIGPAWKEGNCYDCHTGGQP